MSLIHAIGESAPRFHQIAIRLWTASGTGLYRRASRRFRAQVAQLVEHVTENHGVGGSIPSLGTITLEVIERLTSVSGPSRKYGRTSLSSGDQDT